MLLAQEIFDGARGLCNDIGGMNFTNDAMLPYLKIAYDELIEIFEDNDVDVLNSTSTTYIIAGPKLDIGGPTGDGLPLDLVEPQTLYERTSGSNEQFQLMSKVTFLPRTAVQTAALIYWQWAENIISFIGATGPRDVLIEYIGTVFPPIVNANSPIYIINSKNVLKFRTAALSALYIGENPTRAEALNHDASSAMERTININTKSNQGIVTRRRPFRARYKMRVTGV